MRRLAAALALIALALGAANAGAASHTLLPDCGGKGEYKPNSVIIACGDGAFRVVQLDWSTWKKAKAVGHGIAKVNTCKPNCAAGKFKNYKAKLKVTKPVRCENGRRAFSKLTYTFTETKPSGVKRTESVPRSC